MLTTTPNRRDSPPKQFTDQALLGLVSLWYLMGALFVTWWLWYDPASRMVTGNVNDTDQMAWFFRYDATAIGHFHLPALVTTGMNAPQGINVMWNTFMLLPGCVLAPVTWLAGPQASLAVLETAGFAGSALAMYVVLRRWGVRGPAGVLGGAVYGFSPALIHSSVGHFDLQFAVFLPLIVDAAFRLICGRTTAVRGGVYLGAVVAAQLFVNEEMLFDTAVAALVLLVVLAVRYRDQVLAMARAAVPGFAVATAVFAVLAGYPLWVQFFGPLQQHGSPFLLDFFKNDLTGLVVPSGMMLVHTSGSAAEAVAFQGGLSEYLSYLGVPLLLVLVAGSVYWWRRPLVRALALAWLVTEVFSLGGTLLVAGHTYSSAKLPWYWLQSLPLLQSIIPDRFSIVADGAAAALFAVLADIAFTRVYPNGNGPLPRTAWLVPAVAVLAVIPLVPKPLPVTEAGGVPAGWSTVFAQLNLPANANVLVVPIAEGTFTSPLRWQADTGVPRSMVGGYFMGPAWDGHVYIDGNGTPPAGLYLDSLWKQSAASLPATLTGELTAGQWASVQPVTTAVMRSQLQSWQLSAIVAVTTAGSPLADYLQSLLGPPTTTAPDALAWRTG
jgi:hypothetical protein